MILVTRYLLASRVENEANNDLKSSLLGCDIIDGLYKGKGHLSVRFQTPTRYILRWNGVMSAFKERSRASMRFPSQENSLESVK